MAQVYKKRLTEEKVIVCDWCGTVVPKIRALTITNPVYGMGDSWYPDIAVHNFKLPYPPHICIPCRELLFNGDFKALVSRVMGKETNEVKEAATMELIEKMLNEEEETE